MQDRYAGDVGDFMKLGLLRALVHGSGLALGVNWYLAPDESHNADGKHIAYLSPTSRFHKALRACDTELMTSLSAVVATGRSVAALEASGTLPSGSTTYATQVGEHPHARATWHHGALERLAGCNLVFADPDNGIRRTPAGAKTVKYALLDELADYTTRGQSLVVYHHADRTPGGVSVQVAKRLGELHARTGIEPLGAVIARRGSTRFFFVLPANSHRAALEDALANYQRTWSQHVDWAPFDSEGARRVRQVFG
ncbi:hypothetical protein [Demequina sp. NBRC 110054]|uniref:hypothetical protein n=1 Tax=Demequina sp. NBRC 110054 TaxID=1570343 RepID=UPI0011785EB0|nr:hypothetical protein [Demequina sp. NBRC 110054]